MPFDEKGVFRTFLPPGSLRFILSVVCSVIALVSTVSLVLLVFAPQMDSDLMSKLIVGMFVIGVVLVVHPNFRLTRGVKWPLTYMSVLLLCCLLITSITPVFAYFRGLDGVYIGSGVGLVAGILGFCGYRSKALEKLRTHFDQVWQDEHRRQTDLRKAR